MLLRQSARARRWSMGEGLTAEKMQACIWLKPQAVVRIDFLEWTGADHLRHTKFIDMRDDKDPKKVVPQRAYEASSGGPLTVGSGTGRIGLRELHVDVPQLGSRDCSWACLLAG
jgi:hypothetical protein